MKKSKQSSIVFLLVISVLFSCVEKNGTETRPNVLLINVDDLGYGDVGCYGATKVKTPNIDRLAEEGRMFTDAHSVSAVCSPSRYGLITGRYPARADLWSPIFLKTSLVIDTERITIADVMKRAGYATACIGKWHLGFGNKSPVDWNNQLNPGPLELGFDYYFGVPVLNSHPPFVYVENHKVLGLEPDDPMVYGQKAETQEFPEKFGLSEIGGGKKAHGLYEDRKVGTTLKDKAIKWIKKDRNSPFFLYLATTNIHHPFTPDPRFVGTSEAGRYGDFIHELDWMIGEILKTLDQEGLTENTLVIFTSDNGGMLNQGGQDAWRAGHKPNGELLGFKFDAWEGGHRVPFITRWPGKIAPGSKSDQLIGNIDLEASLASLVGIDLQEDEGPDSFDMLPALLGASNEPIRDHLVISPFSEDHIALRKGQWLYISGKGGGGFGGKEIGDHDLGGAAAQLLTKEINSDIKDGKLKPGAPPAQLYNLEEDPFQRVNIYDQNKDVAKRLDSELRKILDNPISKNTSLSAK